MVLGQHYVKKKNNEKFNWLDEYHFEASPKYVKLTVIDAY